VGGLLPNFSKKESRGFSTMNNGGEFHIGMSNVGKKILHLFSISASGNTFRAFELSVYCNYTTIKSIILLHGEYTSLVAKVNSLGKNGEHKFRLKNIDNNIYIETESDTSILEVRVKLLFGIRSSEIIMNVTNEIDLSSAKQLAEF
jgi:uncharacterized alkaline shock family protein YloU